MPLTTLHTTPRGCALLGPPQVRERQRKEREEIRRREAIKEARRQAKLEEERRARQRALAEARRRRDEEMRELRAARAAELKAIKQEARLEREAAEQRELDALRERKSALRHVSADDVDGAVSRVAETRRDAARAAAQRARERASAAVVRAGRAVGIDYVVVEAGRCLTPGCTFQMHHLGPCSNEAVPKGKRRASAGTPRPRARTAARARSRVDATKNVHAHTCTPTSARTHIRTHAHPHARTSARTHARTASLRGVRRGGRGVRTGSINYAEGSEEDFIREFDLKRPIDPMESEARKAREGLRSQPVPTRAMLSTGHALIGVRAARLFGRRLVLGTVTGWLPACKVSGLGALFRLVHDDGDEEDLDEVRRPDPCPRREHACRRA